jgi:hypothetical protein
MPKERAFVSNAPRTGHFECSRLDNESKTATSSATAHAMLPSEVQSSNSDLLIALVRQNSAVAYFNEKIGDRTSPLSLNFMPHENGAGL